MVNESGSAECYSSMCSASRSPVNKDSTARCQMCRNSRVRSLGSSRERSCATIFWVKVTQCTLNMHMYTCISSNAHSYSYKSHSCCFICANRAALFVIITVLVRKRCGGCVAMIALFFTRNAVPEIRGVKGSDGEWVLLNSNLLTESLWDPF